MSKLTIDQKMKILDASESNNNRHNLARQFKVSRKTIQNILEPENKRKLLAAIEISVDPKRRRVQKGPYDELEQALANWAKQLLSATPAMLCSGKTLMVQSSLRLTAIKGPEKIAVNRRPPLI